MRSGISAQELLRARGETIIRFKKPVHLSIGEISRNLSIDDFRNDTIIAYANEKGFNWFSRLNIRFDVLEPPSLNKDLITAKKVNAPDFYPSYEEYLRIMNSYASEYPDICNLVDFGSTVDGRRLLAVKISDNPDEREHEPVVFYTATMHGDEPLGFVVLLKLIDYLLPEYYSKAEIKDLIDQTEIYINPLANPDGAYYISDTSVIGSIRFNKNQVDLNRDFPEIPFDTRDSADLQPETLHMMNFMKDIRPALAANFHSGAELVNYPWDTWITYHSDDTWYRKIYSKYTNTAQDNSPDG